MGTGRPKSTPDPFGLAHPLVRYSLRTLLIVLLVAPPLVAWIYFAGLSLRATMGGRFLLGMSVWLPAVALFGAHFLPLLCSRD